ncbi:WD40/YVTN/BNR-like repeat-containing protein [Algoriphagus namhaensis]|uniref:WD40/YVTN/BNR-like repeat-containing protein n=1 Tax=Algoriphagus namhaensis TaxID=915353 RepID=A0ABV8ARP3_9BACT
MKISLCVIFLMVFGTSELVAQQINARWELKETPVKASLRGLSVCSDEVVWASGSRGTWLQTIDGGESWNHGIIAGLDSVDFRSIHAFNEKVAVAVSAGEPAVIYKTTDGGVTWELKSTQSPPAFLDGIHFVDKKRGYVFGDPVDGKWMFLVTEDGGDNWKRIDQAPNVTEGEAGFAASGSSMVALKNSIWIGSGGKESKIWQSLDRGNTWESYTSPLLQGKPSQGIFAICLVENQRIVAVGGDYLKPEEKGGTSGMFQLGQKSWQTSDASPNGYRSGVTYLKGKKWVIAVGPNGGDISLDQGDTWTSFSGESFHAVKSDSKGRSVWASGAGGRIGKLNFQ